MANPQVGRRMRTDAPPRPTTLPPLSNRRSAQLTQRRALPKPSRTTLFVALGLVIVLALLGGLLVIRPWEQPASDASSADRVQTGTNAEPRSAAEADPPATSLTPATRLWLKAHTAKDTEVALPAATQKEIGNNLPKLQMRSYAAAASHPVDLLVLPPSAREDTPAALQELLESSEPVAEFYDGSQVRAMLKDGTASQALSARKELGRKLVNDSRIGLTPHAWASLTAGEVDMRVMGLLLRVANVHRIDVFGFPREGPERAARAPAREVHVTAVDGQLVSEGATAATQLKSMMQNLPEKFRPAEVGAPHLLGAPDGLLVRFRLATGA